MITDRKNTGKVKNVWDLKHVKEGSFIRCIIREDKNIEIQICWWTWLWESKGTIE